jgi:uncharacterized membrane protein YphA (DoxX/SURF4 family)
LNTNKFTIGISTVVMLVLLRLALGCHFLYEGLWKIRHADQFVGETEGFLSGARGPVAPFFYTMIPDLDGHQRLEGNLAETKGSDGPSTTKLAKRWDELRQDFVRYYGPIPGEEETKSLQEQLEKEAQKVYQRHVKALEEFVRENGDKIKAHFASLKRLEDGRRTDPRTPFQTQRRWDEMQDLRKEAKGWIADLDAREGALKADLLELLDKDRKSQITAVAEDTRKKKEAAEAAKKAAEAAGKKADPAEEASKSASSQMAKDKSAGKPEEKAEAVAVIDFSVLANDRPEKGPFAASRNPLSWKRTEQLAFLLTWSLFGIGVCLVLGLFTRPAALAGAGFMLFVVLSQPSYPFVVPADPPQLGHALLINKDFVEMIALLVIASTCLGRWTGLDFFIYRIFIKPFCGNCCCSTTTEGRKA